MIKIIQKDNPILRKTAAEVPVEQIASAKIQQIIADMKEALATQEDGVAIAAPQIGVPLRIFVISGRVFSKHARKKPAKKTAAVDDDLVFINPVLTKLSKEKKLMSEGCLSVRYFYGDVLRSAKATIQARDEHGQVFERGASGLMAQIFQHETDHLNGILFIDSAKNLQDMPPEEVEEVKL
jgi:peptide deformylase